MASLSDMILKGALDQDGALDTQQRTVATGLKIASLAQNVQQQRQQIEMNKQNVARSKFNTFGSFMDRVSRAKSPAARRRIVKAFGPVMDQIGLPMSEATRDVLANDEDAQRNIQILANAGFFNGLADNPEAQQEVASALIDELGPEGALGLAVRSIEDQRRGQQQQQRERRAETTQERRLTQEVFKNTTQLRKERSNDPITKNTKAIQQSFGKIEKAAKSDTAAGDLNLIFNFMKMLDPGSVVREGEFANAQNTAGVPDRVRNAYNNALRGTRLNTDQRGEFVAQAEDVLKNQLELQQGVDDNFRKIAIENNLDPEQLGIKPEDSIKSFSERKPLLDRQQQERREQAQAPVKFAPGNDTSDKIRRAISAGFSAEDIQQRIGRSFTADEQALFEQREPQAAQSVQPLEQRIPGGP